MSFVSNKKARVLVTGARGMVGTAVRRELQERGYAHVLEPSRTDLDLLDEPAVRRYFPAQSPEIVIHLAAKVGGIQANMEEPVQFLEENTRTELNLLSACQVYNVEKTVMLGSSCIYPRACPQPMREEYLLTGPLEPTNEGYALAKILGLRLAQYMRAQFGMNVICPMPCNLYGTNDHFDFKRSHVLSALVRRFAEAVDRGLDSVTLWGTGAARREFLHVRDAAQAIVFLMETYNEGEIINVGTGEDVSIRELASLVASATKFRGEVLWDSKRPDGMPRKCLDVSRLRNLGFCHQISLENGIVQTIEEFRSLPKVPYDV